MVGGSLRFCNCLYIFLHCAHAILYSFTIWNYRQLRDSRGPLSTLSRTCRGHRIYSEPHFIYVAMALIDPQPQLQSKEAPGPEAIPKHERAADFEAGPEHSHVPISRAAAIRRSVIILVITTLLLNPSLFIRPVQRGLETVRGGRCHKSLSIEERVHNILSRTPLIGIDFHYSNFLPSRSCN